MYYLWSTKLNGWFTRSGTYSSDRSEAKEFSTTEMFSICARQMNNGMSEFGMLPISIDTLEAIAE